MLSIIHTYNRDIQALFLYNVPMKHSSGMDIHILAEKFFFKYNFQFQKLSKQIKKNTTYDINSLSLNIHQWIYFNIWNWFRHIAVEIICFPRYASRKCWRCKKIALARALCFNDCKRKKKNSVIMKINWKQLTIMELAYINRQLSINDWWQFFIAKCMKNLVGSKEKEEKDLRWRKIFLIERLDYQFKKMIAYFKIVFFSSKII